MKIKADEIDNEPCLICHTRNPRKEQPLKIILKYCERDSNQHAKKKRKESSKRKNMQEPQELELEILVDQDQNLNVLHKNTNKYTTHQPTEQLRSAQFNMDSDSAGSTSHPSLWSHCLAKMKEELRAEVIEEVLKALSKKDDSQNKIPTKHAEPGEKVAQIHSGVICDLCEEEIHGIRYKCGHCIDFDLCERCEIIPNVHNPHHIFLKIRYPQGKPKSNNLQGNQVTSFELPTLLEALKIRSEPTSATPTVDFLVHVISDVTSPTEFSLLEPNVKFVKMWKIQNIGSKAWDENTVLKYVCGNWNASQAVTDVAAPKLAPFQEGVISVPFVSPSLPGSYEAYWQFHHNGQGFLDLLYCRVIVGPLTNSNSSSRAVHVKTLRLPSRRYNLTGSDFNLPVLGPVRNRRKSKEEKRKKKDYRTKDVKDIVDVLNAVQGEQRHGPRTVATSSSTTTPNNTPFDLTPPKSPEHHNIIPMKETLSEVSSMNVPAKETEIYKVQDNDDTTPSVISVSSSESDSEFVVIPMPDCFNFSSGRFVSKSSSEPTLNEHSEKKIVWTSSEESNDLSRTDMFVHEASVIENVCQETGAPEETENFNIQAVVSVKDNEELTITFADVVSTNSSTFADAFADASTSRENCNAENLMESRTPFTKTRQLPLLTNMEHNYTITQQPHLETPPPSFGDLEDTSSATFPKFPLEDVIVNNAETSQSVEQDERTIQVLPEGLVTGALLAAASVFNTAKAVISSIQTGKNDDEATIAPKESDNKLELLSPAQQLAEMGFYHLEQNERLLQKHKGNVPLVVAELVNQNDNEWYASRHAANPNSQH